MWRSVFTAIVLTGLMSPAFADDAHHPAGPSPEHAGPAPGMMGAGMKMGCPMMGAHHGKPRVEGHLAFLKAELQISGAQEKAWSVFADTVRGIHKRMHDKMSKMGDHMSMEKGKSRPAPDVLGEHIHMMEMHLDTLKTYQAGVAKLYSALNADQKATADELLASGMGMM